MKAITILITTACSVALTAAWAWAAPKDITSRTNPNPDGTPNPAGSLNVEARYTVHVGLTSGTAGLTTGIGGLETATNVNPNPNYGPTGMVEFASCGGVTGTGNWGRMNNSQITLAGDGNFCPSTALGTGPDYFGYMFLTPAKNLTQIKFWNTVFATGMPREASGNRQGGAGGGMFAATPEVQYLDAPAPHGTWHTIANVSWNVPYNTDLPNADETRAYVITINEALSNVWGVRLYGNGKATGNTYDPDGWVAVQELVVYGELDIGDTDLSKNLALMTNGGTAILNVVHAPFIPGDPAPPPLTPPENVLIDGRYDTRVDTYAYGTPNMEDFFGVMWATPRYRVTALGFSLTRFGDGGFFDDCENPVRVEYTSDGATWIPVTGLQKGRYPDIWQKTWWSAAQLFFLFRFDEVNDALGVRVIGSGSAQGDGDGFLGAWELEVFGVPVLAEIVDYDGDGDVDQTDVALFWDCASGDRVPYATGCANRDVDKDGDVDQRDFAVVQRCFSGGGNHWDPACGQ